MKININVFKILFFFLDSFSLLRDSISCFWDWVSHSWDWVSHLRDSISHLGDSISWFRDWVSRYRVLIYHSGDFISCFRYSHSRHRDTKYISYNLSNQCHTFYSRSAQRLCSYKIRKSFHSQIISSSNQAFPLHLNTLCCY